MSEITKRPIFFFHCIGCGKRRSSLIKERAKSMLCTKCRRRAADIPENQKPLFDIDGEYHGRQETNGQNE